VKAPDVQYARSGDVAIAYQVVGDGPVDLVFFRGMAGDLLSTWDQPLLVRHVEGLTSFSRVLMLDKRGTGLSDRVREPPTLETRMDDVRAVMDAAGSERAAIFSGLEGARTALLFAATYPERTLALALIEPSVRGTATADYPWAPTEEEWREQLAAVRDGWGTRAFFVGLLSQWAPSVREVDGDFMDWFVGHMRRSLSPGAALAFYRAMKDADVTDVLPTIRVPTLILHRPAEREQSSFVAAAIQRAELVEIRSLADSFTWLHDEPHEQTIRETAAFVARLGRPDEPDRVLATILFTDIVASTSLAAELGDAGWRDLLQRHQAAVRRRLAEFSGEEIDTAGDGFFAAFDGPRRAIQAAQAIVADSASLDLELRAGIHTGECERLDRKLTGIAVPIGARISGLAAPAEVLVSSTVKDLVAGSGIEFEDRGAHQLKGVPGEWRLYAVIRT
jgi:class 3 adenylate cyclase